MPLNPTELIVVNSNRDEVDVSRNSDGPTTNDVAYSNPVGRTASDTTALKLRNDLLRIGTWNVRTLYKAGSFVNLISEWIVMSLSEVRWTGFGMMSEEDRVLFFPVARNMCMASVSC